MAFAMRIKSPGADEIEVVSGRSWDENPMGIALKIDPPLPLFLRNQFPEHLVDVLIILSGLQDSLMVRKNGGQ